MLNDLLTFFLFECLETGDVLEVGFLGTRLIVENNSINKRWWF